jgi:hypothetical protein
MRWREAIFDMYFGWHYVAWRGEYAFPEYPWLKACRGFSGLRRF